MARILAAEGGGEVRFRPFPEGHKAIDIGSFSTDNSFIRETLGWSPRVPFAAGALATLDRAAQLGRGERDTAALLFLREEELGIRVRPAARPALAAAA